MSVTIGDQEYFKKIGKIKYEGPESNNPFSFRYYDEDRMIGNITMKDFLKFSSCYWHTFNDTSNDPFGLGTRDLPWNQSKNPQQRARDKMDAAFEFFTKMGVPYYTFHDEDLIEPVADRPEFRDRLDAITEYAKEKMDQSGIKLLWGTAKLFSHPRYMNGAATSPEFGILAYAAGQVKDALDATIRLSGENFVFWGGREGYVSLLNTDMKREQEHLAQFLKVARDYARNQGFKGTFLIEPKPMEPMKHQYDFDAATVIGFLERYNLINDFALNIETNHATLAQHTMEHELQVAADAGALGSIDANRGDHQNGWDTDQFPYNINDTVELMLVVLRSGGLKSGGVNFDAKTRRNSNALEDLFHAHIGGMDTYARALLIAERILKESPIEEMRRKRYESFDSGIGERFEQGKVTMEELVEIANNAGELIPESSHQELYENIINRYI